MINEFKKPVIIIIGPPGSGKDTQAELLAHELKLIHVKTSELIEAKFKSADPNDPVINAEKEKWASGQLSDRDWVFSLISEKVRALHQVGQGMVFSGSPREVFEAQKEIALLEELYGRENIKIVHVELSEDESVKRNSHRRMCQANRHPIPNFPEYENITVCPEDASPIVTRVLDDPEVIKTRYKVYLSQTEPIFDFLHQKVYNIIKVDGEQSIENVHRDILNKLW